MKESNPNRMPVLAAAEWLITLPATLLLAAAALRLLQPRQYEPAHTAWAVFEWSSAHISRLGASVLFLLLPAVAAILGCIALFRLWHQDQGFRQDILIAWDVLRRRSALVLMSAATLLAGCIVCLTVLHMITD